MDGFDVPGPVGPPPGPGGPGGPGGPFGMLVPFAAVLGGMVFVAAAVILLFLVIRYLLAATRAAQLYIELNATPRPGSTVVPVADAPPGVARRARARSPRPPG